MIELSRSEWSVMTSVRLRHLHDI